MGSGDALIFLAFNRKLREILFMTTTFATKIYVIPVRSGRLFENGSNIHLALLELISVLWVAVTPWYLSRSTGKGVRPAQLRKKNSTCFRKLRGTLFKKTPVTTKVSVISAQSCIVSMSNVFATPFLENKYMMVFLLPLLGGFSSIHI
ncbi:hypothetical protein L596_019353 [Steinernema carpocapsae]|uniref:Uncharacterized protein n=1 Tax=Steinernema carpocapsae TaxID=34508 RepID=A0A4V6A0J8_STECR|nr:hypothetical protein L596_019353 [Steinernema carpocapsae]